jgi:hypothetical protein
MFHGSGSVPAVHVSSVTVRGVAGHRPAALQRGPLPGQRGRSSPARSCGDAL